MRWWRLFGIVTMSDMIDHEQWRWNRKLVDEIFHPITAANILEIPLGNQGGVDVLAWPHTSNGIYSSKTCYNFIRGLLALDVPSSSSSSGSTLMPKMWRKFWANGALPRCKETTWIAIQGYLPVREQLFKRHLDVDPRCWLCDHDIESIDHIFLRCPASMVIWYASSLSLCATNFPSFQAFWVAVL